MTIHQLIAPAAAFRSARKFLKTRLFGTVASLYVSQFAAFILPAITIPYLARTLGPAGWGQVAFAQSFGALLSILVEYGFNFSATQQTAANRDNREALSSTVAGTQGAKLLLALVAIVAACIAKPFMPAFTSTLLFAGGVFWAVAFAFNLNWYFLGMEKLPSVIGIELSLKAAAALSLLLLVRSPHDAWKVLVIQGSACLGFACICLCIMSRQVHLKLPRWGEVRAALGHGSSAMLFRGAESVYTQGSPMLLGLLAGPSGVGVYAAAEKICRGVMLPLMDPIQRSLYAEVSGIVQQSVSRAARVVRTSALWSLVIAGLISAIVCWQANLVVRVVLGPHFPAAVPMLRVFCIVPVATAFKWSVGVHWMMLIGKGKEFTRIVMGSSVLYLILAFLLVPRYGPQGMAATILTVELAIPLAAYCYLRLSAADPFQKVLNTLLISPLGNPQ